MATNTFKRKILVIDDDQAICEILAEAFNNSGFTSYTANSAKEGIQIFRQNSIFIYFIDLVLPGMDGLELCKLIKRENPVAYVFAITGYAELFDLRVIKGAGFDNYFLKPFHLAELQKVAEQSFRELVRWHSILSNNQSGSD